MESSDLTLLMRPNVRWSITLFPKIGLLQLTDMVKKQELFFRRPNFLSMVIWKCC